MIKINLHKDLSDLSPFRRYPRKIAFFLLISCTSQMSIIFFLTEGMLRHMKINVSFGPSSGTDMSNFRPWLMDYNALRYIDTVFLGRQIHDNQINGKFEKKLFIILNLVAYY